MNVAVAAIGPDGRGWACDAACIRLWRRPEASAGAVVMVVKATTACFSDMVRVAGYLVPRRMAVVNVEADGYKMTEVMVAEGDQVTSGQVLARLTRQAAEGSNAPAGAGGSAGARPAPELAHATRAGRRPGDAKHRAGAGNGFAAGRAAVPDPGRQRSRARGRNPEHPRGQAQVRRNRADFDCRRRGAGRPGPSGGARYRSEIAARQGASRRWASMHRCGSGCSPARRSTPEEAAASRSRATRSITAIEGTSVRVVRDNTVRDAAGESSASCRTTASRSARASTRATLWWPTPAPRCTMATRSGQYFPANSINHECGNGAKHLGLVDPSAASIDRAVDHPAGARLDELHASCR